MKKAIKQLITAVISISVLVYAVFQLSLTVGTAIETENTFYIRATTENAAAAVAKFTELFGEISLLSRQDAPEGEFAFTTKSISEKELADKLGLVNEASVESVIRITNY